MSTSQEVPVRFYHRISLKEKALFYEHLSNLVDGGVTLIDALRSFIEKTPNPRFFRDSRELLLLIESGDTMSLAMKKFPNTFERSEISIIESGEQSGTMQRSFVSLANDLRSRQELTAKLIGAMTYPAIILAFLILAVVVIMTFVVPKLLPLFSTAWTELPVATKSLVATSEFISNHFILLFVLGISFVALFFSILSTYNGKRAFDRFILEIPLIGRIYRNYLIVRISSILWLLLSAGIPIIKTLKLTAESTGNIVFEEAILSVAKRVEVGKKITESIEEIDPQYTLFTRDFVQLVGAWEKTSTINKVCVKIADQYNREVDASVAMLVKFVEPMAILFAGWFVLWFAFAIFAAVMKITETVG